MNDNIVVVIKYYMLLTYHATLSCPVCVVLPFVVSQNEIDYRPRTCFMGNVLSLLWWTTAGSFVVWVLYFFVLYGLWTIITCVCFCNNERFFSTWHLCRQWIWLLWWLLAFDSVNIIVKRNGIIAKNEVYLVVTDWAVLCLGRPDELGDCKGQFILLAQFQMIQRSQLDQMWIEFSLIRVFCVI